MSAYNKIQDFLETTCSQIRFKSVHKSIINELSDHIEEQKREYIKQGLDEESATAKTLEQMGDPVIVGMELDKAHRPKTEWSILLLAGILTIIGGVVQLFLSRVDAHYAFMLSDFLIYAPIGIAAFAVTYFFDYTLIGRYPKLVYCILLTATIAGFGLLNVIYEAHTAHIYYFGYVYYVALLFIPAYAGVVYSFRNKGYSGIIACCIFYVAAAFPYIIISRFTCLILFTAACLAILTIAIIKGFFKCNKKVGLAIVCIPAAVSVVLSIIYIFSAPYRIARFSALVNPGLDPYRTGYQQLTVKRLLAASKPFGRAVLDGSFKNMNIELALPSWSSNLCLTYIIARLGYVIGAAIILIILILIVRMFMSVVKQKNAFGFLLSCAAYISLVGQFILYIISNLGIIPIAVDLPFISHGRIGFVTDMILVGIVLSVHRRTNIAIDRHQNITYDKRLFTFENGKFIIDFGFKFSKNTD